LRLVPRAPRKIDTATIERHLESDGIVVTRRSIQRDLESLSRVFGGLRCDDRSKPYGWCWDERSPLLEVPGMNVQSAVTFELLRQHLRAVLPRSTVRTLDAHFKRAREVLAHNRGAKMARWPGKVRVVPRGMPRVAPNVDRRVQEAVYTALLEERRLHIRYKKRGSSEHVEYEVGPLGLVLRNGAFVLVCTFWDYKDINQMVLHRMASAEILTKAVKRPPKFNLDEYISAGHVGFRRGEKLIKLKVLLDPQAALALHEAPISDDQSLSVSDDGRERLSATVPDTTELRAWLRSHGAMLEVVAPKRLRHEMAREVAEQARRYAEPS